MIWSFLKHQYNVMLFYINGQEMEKYIYFGENITRRLIIFKSSAR